MKASGKFCAPARRDLCSCQVSSIPAEPRSDAKRPESPPLSDAVVEDRDARRDGGEDRGNRRVLAAVMRNQVHVGVPEQVVRTRERGELLAGQIAKIEERELAKLQTRSRATVHSPWRSLGSCPERRARRVGCPAPGVPQRALSHGAARAAVTISVSTPSSGQPIARRRMQLPPRSRADLYVGKRFVRPGVVLHERLAVVDESSNRQALRDFRRRRRVIAVKVRDQQVVEPVDAGGRAAAMMRFGSRLSGAISSVNEQRLPGRRHDQRGLPAFDVDEVDVEGPDPGALAAWALGRSLSF